MTPLLTTLAPGLLEAGSRLIDRLVPDPAEREKAKLALLQAEGQLALQEMQTSLSAILAEANSPDPWTSRARPTFLYVIYGVILLCVIGAIIGIWWPTHVFQAAENLNKLLARACGGCSVLATSATPGHAASTSGVGQSGSARQFDYRDPGLIIQAMMGSGSFSVSSFSFLMTSGWSWGVTQGISLVSGRSLARPYRPPRKLPYP